MAVNITTQKLEAKSTLVVAGEVDVSNAAELRAALEAELAEGVTAIDVDLADVPYIDSTGIGVLVAFAHEADEAHVSFAVHNPQRNVARVLEMLDLTGKLGISSSDTSKTTQS